MTTDDVIAARKLNRSEVMRLWKYGGWVVVRTL